MTEEVHRALIGITSAIFMSLLLSPYTSRLWRRHYRRRYMPFPVGTMVQWNDPTIQNDHTDRIGTIEAALYFESEHRIGAEVAIEFVCGCRIMGIPVSTLREVKDERPTIADRRMAIGHWVAGIRSRYHAYVARRKTP